MRCTVIFLAFFTFIFGIVYPSVVTLFLQTLFPDQAKGMPELIGQPFYLEKFFWSRPTSTPFFPYNATASSGSNWATSNPIYISIIQERIRDLNAQNQDIPIDLITASGSGLDPHISVAGAYFQAERVAKARNIPINKIHKMIQEYTQEKQFGFLGEARVNVVKLNKKLEKI